MSTQLHATAPSIRVSGFLCLMVHRLAARPQAQTPLVLNSVHLPSPSSLSTPRVHSVLICVVTSLRCVPLTVLCTQHTHTPQLLEEQQTSRLPCAGRLLCGKFTGSQQTLSRDALFLVCIQEMVRLTDQDQSLKGL